MEFDLSIHFCCVNKVDKGIVQVALREIGQDDELTTNYSWKMVKMDRWIVSNKFSTRQSLPISHMQIKWRILKCMHVNSKQYVANRIGEIEENINNQDSNWIFTKLNVWC